MYSQFLWGFPLSYFDFVGVTEHFEADLQFFSRRYFDRDVNLPDRLNASPDDASEDSIDEDLRARVEAFHARDMVLYRHALAARQERTDAGVGLDPYGARNTAMCWPLG